VNDLFLRACRREPVERTPLWLMRQAGRYLPEYRELRAGYDFLTMTRKPELAVEVTLQPIRRFGMDAAILFADILTPIVGAGIDVEFKPGPVIAKPVRQDSDLDPIRDFVAEDGVSETLEAIRTLVSKLDVPLIGFGGAPFTLACYLVDGAGSKDFARTRTMLHRDPELARAVLDAIGDMIIDYARAQVEAGASAIQIFDTWAGLLSPHDFAEMEAPVLRRIFAKIREFGVPSIYYLNGCAALLGEIGKLGADVAGIDWRVPLDVARAALPETMAVQGNLDPLVLLGSPETIRARVHDVLAGAGERPGHVFNLGHGIHKETPPENVQVLVDAVREGHSG
jgi:uroporphyrinogen decarboxylase